MSTATVMRDASASSATDTPAWYLDAIFYEVAVKAFLDGNHDGIGDFAGLASKLDYVQELGATSIWLMPFYPSPWRDDGYDIADFRGVHPSLGTMGEFQEFLREANRRNLRVVADLVVNHTSDQHPWFQAARTARAGSPLRSFYVWNEGERSEALPRDRLHWTWDTSAGAYYRHRFAPHEPDLNYENPEVIEEMTKVIRFWLDLGIDGLSLSGIGFLGGRPAPAGNGVARMPNILAEFRQGLSAYPNRLLAAGVNAWPTESAQFLHSEGCQMAPNLPLAQRMFLALKQEDRHPVVDLLRQTPELAATCQWLILLRNHDELALELATDEERDYMYRQYAADPKMRLQQGILRRLAPLLENSRARLELMFGLLFALPGAPLLYYGDEIGMGDNVYLGDRNGVRTPMQWTADRNAGFSRAEFARLYAPPVLDPVFGHASVNVESQRRDPSSMFHWLRRLIALRKRLPALSRGSVVILEPDNRRVMALLRQSGEETILVVANFARSLQAVELDLSSLAGLVPVEAFGRSVLPAITHRPYLLTLSPHACHWFLLQKKPEQVWQRLAPVPVEPRAHVPTLEVEGELETALGERGRRQLEASVLPGYLTSQRWFGGKARQVQSVEVLDSARLPAEGAHLILMLLRAVFSDGKEDTYFLPLVIRPEQKKDDTQAAARFDVARLKWKGGEAMLQDALADDAACDALIQMIATSQSVPMADGVVRGLPTTAYSLIRGPTGSLPIRRAPATSSNSLVLFGQRMLLKLFRRLEPGINPDVEIGRYFTEKHAFRPTPRLAGSLEYQRPGKPPLTLAILQSLVPNQGDGWEHVIAELGRYYERASGRMRGPDLISPDRRTLLELVNAAPPPVILEAIGGYVYAAATLGTRTAEMHLALAADDDDPAFKPEPLGESDRQELLADIVAQGESALSATAANLKRLPADIAGEAERLLSIAPAALQLLRDPEGTTAGISIVSTAGGMKTRCHGDYHLGQVLWVDNDFVILDFEGEPTRSVEARRAKQSPLKDVAGMLRSYDYAAYAGLFAYAESHPDDFALLEPWARLWQQWVSAAFLGSYLGTLGETPLLPVDRGALSTLLNLHLLGKALYELAYELNTRPDWVRIPLRGVLDLLESKESPAANKGAVPPPHRAPVRSAKSEIQTT